jgi:hypothetical protein
MNTCFAASGYSRWPLFGDPYPSNNCITTSMCLAGCLGLSQATVASCFGNWFAQNGCSLLNACIVQPIVAGLSNWLGEAVDTPQACSAGDGTGTSGPTPSSTTAP